MPERRIQNTEKARDTTLDDENYEVRYTGSRRPTGKNMTEGAWHVRCSDGAL